MNRLFLITLLPLLIATSFSAQAVPIGPTYPASGGNNFTSNSVSAADGTAIWSYSNFDVSGLNKLYFGLDQMTYGPAGAGLNFNHSVSIRPRDRRQSGLAVRIGITPTCRAIPSRLWRHGSQ